MRLYYVRRPALRIASGFIMSRAGKSTSLPTCQAGEEQNETSGQERLTRANYPAPVQGPPHLSQVSLTSLAVPGWLPPPRCRFLAPLPMGRTMTEEEGREAFPHPCVPGPMSCSNSYKVPCRWEPRLQNGTTDGDGSSGSRRVWGREAEEVWSSMGLLVIWVSKLACRRMDGPLVGRRRVHERRPDCQPYDVPLLQCVCLRGPPPRLSSQKQSVVRQRCCR